MAFQKESNNRWIQYYTAFAATFCMLISGMHFGWSSPSLPKLLSNESTIKIDSGQSSWIASFSLLGDLIGAPMSATFADTFGRKAAILFSAVPYIISWIMIAWANSFHVLLIARFICGIGDGIAFTITPMFIGEIAEDDIRGLLGSLVCTMCDFGIFIIYAFGPYYSIQTSAYISLIFPILLFVMLVPMPETPYFLLMKKKEAQAKKSLQRLRGNRNVDLELLMIKKSVDEQMANPGTFREIFYKKSNRSALFILIGLKGAQQLSGISAFLFYIELIFHQNKSNLLTPEISSMLFALLQIITSVSSSLFIDKLGRKPLLLISLVGCAIPLSVQSLMFYCEFTHEALNWLPLANMLIFIIAYSVGLGIVPYMMPGELFPTNIKAKALGLMDIYLALSAFTVAKVYQIVSDAFGNYVPFAVFAVCCLINALYVIYYVPETKAKSLNEIQYWLKYNKYEDSKDQETLNTAFYASTIC